ncbi:MAG: hypothetical protein MRZ79_26480 [Bacteroidia bacterium]|nr:hypothetical protein [Bacteroidia bacterium]
MHRFLRLFVLLGLVISSQLQAQVIFGPPSIGGRAAALGNAYTAVKGDIWSSFHNPATLAGISNIEVGTYVEQRFLLSELTFGSAAIAYPFTDDQAAALFVSSRGFSAYRESVVGLAYGITLLDKISLGARLNLANLAINNYGSVASVYGDFGVHYQFNSQIGLGASMSNINQAQVTNNFGEASTLPTIISLGVSYQPTKQVLVLVDAVKQVDQVISFRGGVEYQINEILYGRLGFGTEPLYLSGGAGVKWNGLKLDFAMSYTELLQYTPHFSVAYTFGNKNN